MIEALHDDGVDSPAQCLEKRVYYKVISGTPFLPRVWLLSQQVGYAGLHASISTHICHEYLNQTTGKWVCLYR